MVAEPGWNVIHITSSLNQDSVFLFSYTCICRTEESANVQHACFILQVERRPRIPPRFAGTVAARFHVPWHQSATYAKVMRIRASSQEGFEESDFRGVNGETLPGEFLLEKFGT